MATPTQSAQQGWNQSTAAQQQLMAQGLGAIARSRVGRKVRKAVKKVGKKLKASKAGKKLKRLVKGSKAAKRYMAKIRAMR